MTTPGKAVCRECGAPNFGQGYCQKHWRRAMSAGLITTKNRLKVCTFDGCQRPHHCKGLCRAHYDQQLDGRELSPIGVPKTRVERGCDFPGCDRPHSGKGWCKEHNRQVHRGRGMYPIGKFPRSRGSDLDNPRRAHRKTDPSKPRTPKPKAAPTLPPGWNAKAKTSARPITEQGGGGIRSLPPTPPITPELRAIALDKLARLDALDVADYLFGTRRHDDDQPVTPVMRNPVPKWLPALEEALACGWLPVPVILGDIGVLPETAVKTLQGCGMHELARRIQRAVPMWKAAA